MNDLLQYRFLDNSVLNWGLATLAFLFTFLVIPFIRGRLRARRLRWAEHRRSTALDPGRSAPSGAIRAAGRRPLPWAGWGC